MSDKIKECDSEKPVFLCPQSLFERLQKTTINYKTFLSTDYLNHFNEIIMMIGMIKDMPEIIEDCKEWKPKSYINHFAESSLSYKDIAVESYSYVRPDIVASFENLINVIDNLIINTVERLDIALQIEDEAAISRLIFSATNALNHLIDVASGIIHGADVVLNQEKIDKLMDF